MATPASNIDPDVAADFSPAAPTNTVSTVHIDPDVAADFALKSQAISETGLTPVQESLIQGDTGGIDTTRQSRIITHGMAQGLSGALEGSLMGNPMMAQTLPWLKTQLGLDRQFKPRDIGERALSATGNLIGGTLGPLAFPAMSGASDSEKILNSPSAQEVVNQAAAKTSGGAASAGIDVSQLTPETQAEIARAGPNLNQTALDRHALTETLPLPEEMSQLRLRKGQATGDLQQISDEKNLRADPDTQGILTDSITDQDKKLVASIGEIRRRATPDIVQMDNLEHGQAAIDAIKTTDNSLVQDTRAKYKAFMDAAGGAAPIDTGTFSNTVDAALQKKFLTGTAAKNPVISEIMDNIRTGQPLDFESFKDALSNLSGIERKGGADGMAATIVRGNLENMPLTQQAQGLKGLLDTARTSAANRFQIIRDNPAYEAAINDGNSKIDGLHVIGKDSPLADSFMDRYFLGNGPGAARASVANIKNTVPDLAPHVEAATLNKLRDAAGVDAVGNSTGFRNDSFRNQVNALDKKSDVLVSPQTNENIQHLKKVGGFINDEGKAASTNRSNTALTLRRFGAPKETGPPSIPGTITRAGVNIGANLVPGGRFVQDITGSALQIRSAQKTAQALKNAKLQFALDAVKPGAGLGQ